MTTKDTWESNVITHDYSLMTPCNKKTTKYSIREGSAENITFKANADKRMHDITSPRGQNWINHYIVAHPNK